MHLSLYQKLKYYFIHLWMCVNFKHTIQSYFYFF